MSVIYVSEIEKFEFKRFRNDPLPHNCQHGGFSTCFLKDATFFIMSKLTTIRLICTSGSLVFENYILKKPVGLLHLLLICLIIHSKKQSEHHYTPCHIIIMSVQRWRCCIRLGLYILKICQSVFLLTGDIQTYRKQFFKVKNGNKDEWHVRLLYS